MFIITVITGPPNGSVLFCLLSSVIVCNAAGGRAGRLPGGGLAGSRAGPPGRPAGPGVWAVDAARRASTVTSH